MIAARAIVFYGVVQDGEGLAVVGYGADPVEPITSVLRWYPKHRLVDAIVYARQRDEQLKNGVKQ